MKMLTTLAAAAGVAIAAQIPGLVSAQAPARITIGQFVVDTIQAPGPPAVKVEVEKVDVPRAEAPAARQEIVRPGVRAIPAPVNVEAMARQATEQLRVQLNVRPAMPQANVDAMARQMTEQLRPVFRAELRLLTSAAGLTATQRREIAIDGGRAAKEAGRKFAEYQAEINQNGRVRGALPDGRKMIRNAFAEAARARLAPDQWARYEAETDARLKDQREVVVLNLVASLDNLLILGPDQRERLCASLLAHWNDRFYPTLETLANYDGYFPTLPDESIVPHLDERQKAAWRGAQKVTFGQSINFAGNMRVEEGAVDEDEKAAFAEEPKP